MRRAAAVALDDRTTEARGVQARRSRAGVYRAAGAPVARGRHPHRPGGPRDAAQFDVAISPDGKRVAWVGQRVNVVFGTIDYRRYMAGADGSSPRQVASSGGRPFVEF